MMRRTALTLLIGILACAGAPPASAEQLVVSLSNHRVAITSNFVGEDLVLFGTIEASPGKTLRRNGYDLVVTVTGPRVTMRTRRKERAIGIWVNVAAREFVRVPSYLAILSNKPVNEIANPDMRRRLQIGLQDFLLPQRIGPDIADTVRNDPFRVAFVRLESEHKLYLEIADSGDLSDADRVPRRHPAAGRCADRQLQHRRQAIRRRRLYRPHHDGARGDQGRLRAICRRGRTKPRAALRPGHHGDGAAHRLVRQRGVPAGLGFSTRMSIFLL